MGKLRKYPETLWTQAPGLWSDYGNLSRDGASLQEELGKKWREELSKEGGKETWWLEGKERKLKETKGPKPKDNFTVFWRPSSLCYPLLHLNQGHWVEVRNHTLDQCVAHIFNILYLFKKMNVIQAIDSIKS